LVLAQFASGVGRFMVLAAMPFAVFSIGGSTSQIGIALACEAGIYVSFLLVGGVVGDWLPRRSVLVGADLLRFGSQGSVAVLLILGDATFWQLVLAQAMSGLGAAFFSPTMTGFVREVASKEHLQKVNGLRKTSDAAAAVAGPALAAVLVAGVGPGWAFGVDALSFLASAILLVGVRRRAGVAASEARDKGSFSMLASIREGWVEFQSRTWLWAVVLEFAVLNALVVAPFFVLGPSMADGAVGGASGWAIILCALAAGEATGGVIGLGWTPSRPLVAASLAVTLWATPLLALAALAPMPLVAGAAVLGGAGLALFGVLWETTLQGHVPAKRLARVMSYDELGSSGVLPVGYLVGGTAVGLFGPSAALLGGVAVLLVATGAVLAVPSVRRLTPAASDGSSVNLAAPTGAAALAGPVG
jgi:MFS family permease